MPATLIVQLSLMVILAAASVCLLQKARRLSMRIGSLESSLRESESVQGNVCETQNDLATGLSLVAANVDELKASGRTLERRLFDVEESLAIALRSRKPPSGLNIDRRTEIRRLLQEDAPLDSIAADLGTPLSEVRLVAHLARNQNPKPLSQTRQREVA